MLTNDELRKLIIEVREGDIVIYYGEEGRDDVESIEDCLIELLLLRGKARKLITRNEVLNALINDVY